MRYSATLISFFLYRGLLFGLLLTTHCFLVVNSGFKISHSCTFPASAITTHYEKQFTSPYLLPTTTRQGAPSAPHLLLLMPLCDLLPLSLGRTQRPASILWKKLWNVTYKVNLQKQWLPFVGKAHMTRPPPRKELTPSVQQPTSN